MKKLFNWLFKPKPDSEILQFVKKLSERGNSNIRLKTYPSRYRVILQFEEQIEIELIYRFYRYRDREWEISIWSGVAHGFLYKNDIFEQSPIDAIQFIVDKYNIGNIIDAANEEREKEQLVKENIICSIKNKILEIKNV